MSDTAPIEPGDLCLDCGMCCNGHVFTHLALTESDRDTLRAAGLHHAGTQDRFDLPCRFLDGGRCTIYASRPAVCASYRCKTLAQAQDGAVSLDEAKERIDKVAELRRAFEAATPSGMTVQEAYAMAAREETPEHYLPLRLAYVALQVIIDRHLREDGDGIVRQRTG